MTASDSKKRSDLAMFEKRSLSTLKSKQVYDVIAPNLIYSVWYCLFFESKYSKGDPC
jgi:hypothetical protein